MDPQVGQFVNNKYRLLRLIGDGGMGSVFEARHELLGTTVALKFLHNQLARRKGLVERFLQEARVSARIKSPHVTQVSDVDRTPEGLAYMVMEYVEGDTLQTLYEKNYQRGVRLSYSDAFDIFLQMLEGVSAAHTLGIVHRDLKPDNVMLSKDVKGKLLVKLLDFGIAKLKASGEVDRGLTKPGVVMGTPEYMAPEQAFSADRVDARADIFSLGVMFFEMLAGRRPVGGDNAHAIAAQYLEGNISRLHDLAPAIDADLSRAVHKAMQAKPDDRYTSVDAFRAAIEEFSPAGPPRVRIASGDAMADTADEASLREVPLPKTVPPEETFTPQPVTDQSGVPATRDDHEAEASSDDAPEEDATRALPLIDRGPGAPITTDDAEGAQDAEAVRVGTEQIPQAEMDALRAGTEAMPPDWSPPAPAKPETPLPLLPLIDRGPGAPIAGAVGAVAALTPGATEVGDAPAVQPSPPPNGPARHAPMADGSGRHVPMSALAPAPRQKRGPSFLSILLVAATISGLVVGGVYLAHRAQQGKEDLDDPYPFDQPTPTKVATEPPPVNTPPDTPPDTPPPEPAQPDPVPRPTPKPGPSPKPQPTAQPTSKPEQPPPFVLPSALPTVFPSSLPPLFPIPGNAVPAPDPTPAPGPVPPPQAQPQPRPRTNTTRSPRIFIPRPKPSPAQGDAGNTAPTPRTPAAKPAKPRLGQRPLTVRLPRRG